MRRLFFNEILIMSEREQNAIKIKFDSGTNIICGPNGVGKSFLIKCIFYCLGAEPPVSERWKSAEPTILLRFNINGANISALRYGKKIAIYDDHGAILSVFNSVINEFAPYWAELCDFRLLLENKSNKQYICAPPAFYFLPFYIDQENGWKSPPLHSFQRMEQFTSPIKDVIYYHSGIRPNEYYQKKTELNKLREKENELKINRVGLETVRSNLQEKLSLADFSLDKDSYTEEIRELIKEAGKLKTHQDKYKSKISELENSKHDLKLQIEITRFAIQELRTDFQYAMSKINEHYITCPMCGAMHENSFGERFQLAQDQENLDEFYKQLIDELALVEEKIDKEKKHFDCETAELEKIERLMSVKKYEVELRDIIESEGKKEIKRILKTDAENIMRQIFQVDGDIEEVKRRLSEMTSKERKNEIEGYYCDSIDRYINELDVSDAKRSGKYRDIEWKVKLSGSQIPRGILAYYYALANTCYEYGSAIIPPLVIDAPRQQEMDQFNYPKALQFIEAHTPQSAQLILGIVDDAGLNLPGNRIELNCKDYVLNKASYKEVNAEMYEYINQTYFR